MPEDESKDLLRQLLAQNAELMRQNAELVRDMRGSARARDAGADIDTPLSELWDQWAVWADHNVGSWPVRQHHRRALMTTAFKMNGRSVTLAQLRPSDLTKHTSDFYRAARALAPGKRGKTVTDMTIDTEWTTLQMMLAWFVGEGRLEANPIAGWKRRGQGQVRQTYLSPEDFMRFISHGRPLLQDIALVAYRCLGMRNSEVRLLKKSEVNLKTQEIHLSGLRNKNGKPRFVPVPSDAMEVIKRRMAESKGPYVFVMPDDPRCARPVHKNALWRWWKKCREDSGMEGVDGEVLCFHHSRHGGISTALEAMDIASVSTGSGASVKVITTVYEKWTQRRKGVARERLDAQADAFKPVERRGPVGVVPSHKDDAANE